MSLVIITSLFSRYLVNDTINRIAAIYDLLRLGSEDFAQFLHFKGFNVNGYIATQNSERGLK